MTSSADVRGTKNDEGKGNRTITMTVVRPSRNRKEDGNSTEKMKERNRNALCFTTDASKDESIDDGDTDEIYYS